MLIVFYRCETCCSLTSKDFGFGNCVDPQIFCLGAIWVNVALHYYMQTKKSTFSAKSQKAVEKISRRQLRAQ